MKTVINNDQLIIENESTRRLLSIVGGKGEMGSKDGEKSASSFKFCKSILSKLHMMIIMESST